MKLRALHTGIKHAIIRTTANSEVFISDFYTSSTGKFCPTRMRFEVLTAIKMPMLVFWVVTPCGLLGGYPEDGGSMFLRNVGIYLQVHTALQFRRPTWTHPAPCADTSRLH
jgi:hypothetical protein